MSLSLEKFRLSMERSGRNWFGCLTDEHNYLVASTFGSDSNAVQEQLIAYSKRMLGDGPTAGKQELTHQMVTLFAGADVSKSPALNTSYVSKFQRRVYRVLAQIPRGKVTTYGLIAKRIKSAPRAVGRAVASNPWPLFVPCQRVVNADLTVGNYSMCGTLNQAGTVAKRTILHGEHVPMRGDKIDPEALWDPSENTH